MLMHPLQATQVRANLGEFIDTVVREKPMAVKRNRDVIVAASIGHWRLLLSSYQLTIDLEQDEDGRFAGTIEEIPFIVADGQTIEELRMELARKLMEYAEQYEDEHHRYFNAPNTRSNFPFVLRVLLEDDIKSVAGLLHA